MLIKAQEVTVTNFKQENGIFTIEWKNSSNEVFDFDVKMKVKTDAKLAKLTRFFEFVTLESNSLESKFSPLDEPVKAEAPSIVSDFKLIDKAQNMYEMKCPYDPSGKCIGKAEGGKPFDSDTTIKMVSQYSYQKLINEKLLNESIVESWNITQSAYDEYLPFDHVYYYVSENSIQALNGEFKNGKLEGPVKFDFISGKIMEGFAKSGVLHGVARVLDVAKPLRLRNK